MEGIITMENIMNAAKMIEPDRMGGYIAYLAMRDTPMTDAVVRYGIELGTLLPDYKCGWSKE